MRSRFARDHGAQPLPAGDDGERPAGRRRDSLVARAVGAAAVGQTVFDLLDMVVALAVSAVDGVDGASVSVLVSDARVSRRPTPARHRCVPSTRPVRTGPRASRPSAPATRWSSASPSSTGRSSASRRCRPAWRRCGPCRCRTGQDVRRPQFVLQEHAGPWDGPAATVARGLAAQAAVVLANAASLASSELANHHLEQALESRDLIGQAKGIIIAREGVSADDAFDILRRASQRNGGKLRDIAVEVVAQLGNHGREPRRPGTRPWRPPGWPWAFPSASSGSTMSASAATDPWVPSKVSWTAAAHLATTTTTWSPRPSTSASPTAPPTTLWPMPTSYRPRGRGRPYSTAATVGTARAGTGRSRYASNLKPPWISPMKVDDPPPR